ncbi:MAG: hypothetical protein M1830_000615 [Pleopsidium flavum]|nr:MAG: hypothetical protein M1830_000615 [Pleopsidium flavum]
MSGVGRPPTAFANHVSQPRRIRFVPSDGQPRTKRRRITAAYVRVNCQCLRRTSVDLIHDSDCSDVDVRRAESERSGAPVKVPVCMDRVPARLPPPLTTSVCKTCSDNGHTCLGYAEPNQLPNGASSESRLSREDGDGPSSPTRSTTYSPDGGFPMNESEGSTKIFPDEWASPRSNHTSLGGSNRSRVPYFRYFGPTAIVPGFKQMVVQVNKEQHRAQGAPSVHACSPASGCQAAVGDSTFGGTTTPSHSRTQFLTLMEIPLYDATDSVPSSPLITHLFEIFFLHLGCNYPFLQRDRFMRDLDEKRLDAILVDAICALAARFSTHPLLTTPNTSDGNNSDINNSLHKSDYGQAFARRAMSAVVGSFSCPKLAVVQACLLLAYEQFGSDRDSGLWMYLGIAIRMAQDLGLQKLDGIRFEGRVGPTPKSAKGGQASKFGEKTRGTEQLAETLNDDGDPVFFLDRVISSGTGRPVTLRDKDIELSFRSLEEVDLSSGWPVPFPALIRIIHLYGRVTDLLNSIREVNHVTPGTLQRLAGIENDLTDIYQGLSPKLHFNAVNFQHYVKNEQGTNFILFHFWFHTLIVLLHQPTLLNSYEGRIQQLLPNSRELSMSSAKTIADILAFAELMDARSFIGNPFTSQPMYIAACAFLLESAAHTASQPQSRSSTPPPPRTARSDYAEPSGPANDTPKTCRPSTPLLRTSRQMFGTDHKSSAKHTLLATAANQNYQRCYKALKLLETYWAGTKYIVTVLDQKAKGIGDPLLYTSEEMDSALKLPKAEPAFRSSDWRRRMPHSESSGMSVAGYSGNNPQLRLVGETTTKSTSSIAGPNQGELLRYIFVIMQLRNVDVDCPLAIGWSLTGTTNSPNPSLSFLYQTTNGGTTGPLSSVPSGRNSNSQLVSQQPVSVTADASGSSCPVIKSPQYSSSSLWPPSQHPGLTQIAPSTAKYSPLDSDPVTTSDAEMLLGLHSPYTNSCPQPIPTTTHAYNEAPSSMGNPNGAIYGSSQPPHSSAPLGVFSNNGSVHGAMGGGGPTFADMMIETQDIDMSTFGGDMAPWLEYRPQDVLNFFDTGDGGLGQLGP